MSSRRMQQRENGPMAARANWGGVLAAVLGVLVLMFARQGVAADIVVYKSPTCGCCGEWVEHMRDAGFTVDVEDRRDLVSIKQQMGVPRGMQSCHTAKVGDYFVEGHAPAGAVKRLLAEKPDIKGLAVPGMPMGSPGMDGPRRDPYDVMAVGKDGRAQVYERHRQ
ncbi:MAG: DUF411 domain-containing protein [Chromatiaceae bacterium]|nr:DUF411 domain-containing protein [Chromatiaceae bacterium]MCP5306996.1 DUF411 domain-containing protein [Chromatiaceae bacterium]MCP5423376.1 DUF411 domain-containing protein [Chromatiaceae bacterium]